MQLKRSHFLTLILILGLTLTACGGGAPKVNWTLEVSGAVETPLTLSYADLTKMPQKEMADLLMQKSLGEDEVASWSGAVLDDIFAQAGVTDYASVTAIAADGYAVEISNDELQDAIIALKKDGQWITKAEPDKGPIRLVCPETPASRWIFQIQKIQVNP